MTLITKMSRCVWTCDLCNRGTDEEIHHKNSVLHFILVFGPTVVNCSLL